MLSIVELQATNYYTYTIRDNEPTVVRYLGKIIQHGYRTTRICHEFKHVSGTLYRFKRHHAVPTIAYRLAEDELRGLTFTKATEWEARAEIERELKELLA